MNKLKKTGLKTPYKVRKAQQVLRHKRKHSKAQVTRAKKTIRKHNAKHTGKKRSKVKITSVHPGLLAVPPGKKVTQLPLKHFVKLAKRKGHAAISRGLVNLQRWNKNKNKKLSAWAKRMNARLRAALGKPKLKVKRGGKGKSRSIAARRKKRSRRRRRARR